MDSNEQAIEQAQDQYRRLYQSMSADPWGWNLYAVAGGVVLCRAHETGNLLVQNVHCMSERQMVNQMRVKLEKRTPTAWLGNVVQVMDQGRELCCLYLERVKIGHLHRTAYANDRYSRRLLVFEDTVENITIPTRRVLEIEVEMTRTGKFKRANGVAIHRVRLYQMTRDRDGRWQDRDRTHYWQLTTTDAQPLFERLKEHIETTMNPFEGGPHYYAKV